jgi:hypothetical protein
MDVSIVDTKAGIDEMAMVLLKVMESALHVLIEVKGAISQF